MKKKHREKGHNTGKTQGILSRLECGHPVSVWDKCLFVIYRILTVPDQSKKLNHARHCFVIVSI